MLDVCRPQPERIEIDASRTCAADANTSEGAGANLPAATRAPADTAAEVAPLSTTRRLGDRRGGYREKAARHFRPFAAAGGSGRFAFGTLSAASLYFL